MILIQCYYLVSKIVQPFKKSNSFFFFEFLRAAESVDWQRDNCNNWNTQFSFEQLVGFQVHLIKKIIHFLNKKVIKCIEQCSIRTAHLFHQSKYELLIYNKPVSVYEGIAFSPLFLTVLVVYIVGSWRVDS